MSKIKDKLTKEVEKIDVTITDPNEKEVTLKAVQNMIGIFTEELVTLSERQTEMDDRIDEVYEMLSDIEEEIVSNFPESFDAKCPYCDENVEFKFPTDESTEFECPNCHKMIELELMIDNMDKECGCGCCNECSDDDECDCGCDDCDCGCDECDCDDCEEDK